MIWAFKKIVRQIVGDKAISDYKQWKTGKRGLNANFSWRPDDGLGGVTAQSSKNPLCVFFEKQTTGSRYLEMKSLFRYLSFPAFTSLSRQRRYTYLKLVFIVAVAWECGATILVLDHTSTA